jgi:hypothetical protein
LVTFAGCADLVVSRVVPWGQHVELDVWTSLVAPLPIEDAMVRMVASNDGRGQSLTERVVVWFERLVRWACQAEVRVRTDRAAIVTEDRRQLVVRVPQSVPIDGSMARMSIDSLGDAGAVQVRLGADGPLAIAAGVTVDIALAPTPGGDGWVPVAGDWRAIVGSRLNAGLPVGRLTITNLGLRRTGQGR